MPDVETIAAERVAVAWPVQAELLGLPEVPAHRARAARPAGRPVGSRNKRSEQLAVEVIERFGDPLLHQAAIATMGVEDLAARLGCSALEAAQEKRLAALVVLPYLHRRMPLSVDLSAQRVVHLTIVDGAADAAMETEELQAVAEVADAPV